MGLYKAITFAILTAILAYKIHNFVNHTAAVPDLKPQWWGPGEAKNDDKSIKNIEIVVTENIIEDLNQRLKNTRFPTHTLEGIQFQYGFNSNTLKKIVDYWLNEYKWYDRQAYLNKYPHHVTKIQGLDIHFVHVKPENSKNSIPILLLHGWPGSFREFYPLLDVLTDKKKNFDVEFEFIVPSLPGYGWSSAASKPGLGPAQIGVIFRELMQRLGHKQWYIQGGDWGSQVASFMGALYPEEVAGIHLNLCFPQTRKTHISHLLMSVWPSLFMEESFVKRLYPVMTMYQNLTLESGYFHIQATKPDTVGAGLADSPSGLAAYILEKFSTGTKPSYRDVADGGFTERFKYDDLLDNVMIYWLTNSMTSAMRLYAETYMKENRALDLQNVQIKVPTWCARFPYDIAYYPDWMIRHRYPMLKGTSDFKEGGHFIAMEAPVLLANDIILAVKSFEQDKPILKK